ncbi:MAG: phytanoyl-CoA dioxygenase family protein [Planctomycetota bacterium]|nr:phytanoyl-CoA dioxygenase family protein [Planctomycetota bacterium]
MLAKDGFIVIKDYLAPETCDELRQAINATIESGKFIERNDMDIKDAVSRKEPVLSRRHGQHDDGMLDLFNVDTIHPRLRGFREDPFLNEIITRAAGTEFSPMRINAYINKGVSNPRGYHADTYRGSFKTFVYLTDVPDNSYGPYSFIKGSHELSSTKRKIGKLVNRLKGKPSTDAVFHDPSKAHIFIAPRGTLIITNQAGIHRGLPQEEGKERILITTSYTPA